MPRHPLGWSVDGFAAVLGQPRPDAAHNGGIGCDTGNYRLALGESGQLGEQCTSGPFDRLSYGLLVDRINDTHDDLRHALGKDVLVQLPRTLSDEAYPDAELASLAKYLLQNICRDNARACGRETVSLFQKREDRVIQEVLTFVGVP